jgi:hypothetical protein
MKPLAGEYCGRPVAWLVWFKNVDAPVASCDFHVKMVSEQGMVERVKRAPTVGDKTTKAAITSGCKYQPHAARPLS